MLYEVRFIDYGDRVFGTQVFGAEHDEAAKTYANKMLISPFGKGYEIWHGDRLIHIETYR